MRSTILVATVLALLTVIPACGSPTSPSNTVVPSDKRIPSALDRYLPLAVGSRWTYDAIDPATGATTAVESVVESLEDVGGSKAGIMAFHVRSTTPNGSTVNWQQDLGTSVVRHREQFFGLSGQLTSDYFFLPNRVRLDESPDHLKVGATWTENHTAQVTTLSSSNQTVSFGVTWTVEAIDESVTVPAGTFSCLRIRRVVTGYSPADDVFWFARKIGKVQETGAEPRKLTGYDLK